MLYHGSPYRVKYLNPYNLHGDPNFRGKQYVFASPVFEYALLFAGKKWTDRDLSITTKGQGESLDIHVTEMIEGSFNRIFLSSGYVYVINDIKDFKCYKSKWEYVCDNKVEPFEMLEFDNVLEEISKYPSIVFHPYNLESQEVQEAIKISINRAFSLGYKYLSWRLEGLDKDFIKVYQSYMERRR